MSGTVISLTDVSMGYRIYRRPIDIVKEAILGDTRHDTFWALRDLDLEVREGERLGIVGPNGAGKSTLLKIICGNLTPTKGRLKVDGRISSLLSMAPAWNEEENGIENIKFNLLLQGMPRSRISLIVEEIIDFTELGAFIYQPVKTYSTGMSARLSFAIATATDPDILIIDEVLSTGDGYFAAKAYARMKDFCARGRALLFVSHSTQAMRSMCNRCIWIENGVTRLDGPSDSVVLQYENDLIRTDEETNRAGNKVRLERARHKVSLEDISEGDLWTLRIRPQHGLSLTDTHYIRHMQVFVDDASIPIPIESQDLRNDSISGTIDTHSCEWGRVFELQGEPTRTLASRIGVRKGGRLLARRTRTDGRQSVRLAFEHKSILDVEQLGADILDEVNAEWKALEIGERTKLADGWTRVELHSQVDVPDSEARNLIKAITLKTQERPVEIEDVVLIANGKDTTSIPESSAFKVQVRLKWNEPIDETNISLNIYRGDGVYVFYQATCLDGVVVQPGEDMRSTVEFFFDVLPFGSGSYEISVFATSVFTLDTAPPSEIFDKKIGVRFDIYSEKPFVFGLVKTSASVLIQPSASAAQFALHDD